MTSPKFLPQPRTKLFLVRRVTGNSMLPTLAPGTIVLAIRPRKLKPGDIVVVRHNGLEKIKRVKDIRPNQVFLTGDNPKASTDSRDFGWVDTQVVIAKVAWSRSHSLATHD